jgi:hypothetical protein
MSTMRMNDFKVSTIKASSVKSLPSGAKMVYLNYGGGATPIYIQTPELEVPFDPKFFADNGTNTGPTGKHNIGVSLKGMDSSPALQMFHDKMVELDTFLKETAKENSKEWFKKPSMSDDAIENLYTPLIKVYIDPETGEATGKYAPTFKFKVPKRDNKYTCKVYTREMAKNKEVFDINHETDSPVDFESVLMKGSKIKVVLKCNGIWLANGKFGCTWKAEQMCVKVPEGGLQDFAINDDSDDEDDNAGPSNQAMIDSSSDEEVETPVVEKADSSEEEDEEPPPPPKKKVARKVKVKGAGK